MCGLAALFEPERRFDPALLDAIDRDLAHRGPDGAGRHVEPGLALVFRRLAILDPSAAADQPMHRAGSGLSLVFNGEIYNYRALRAELEAGGARFRSSGDTEVILAGYERWGEAVVERLEGMFALVLVDRHAGIALAARDPFGIKPLHMARVGGLTAFASTLRPLRRLAGTRVDAQALAELATFAWAAAPLGVLEGIEPVPGGTVIRVPLAGGEPTSRRVHDVLDGLGGARDLADPVLAVAGALERSVVDHLASDVGYAVQLSGGVDSGVIAALATRAARRPIASFAVNLAPSPHDEGEHRAPIVARHGLDHTEVALDGRAFADVLPRAIAHMEGPLPHMGCAMLMLLCDRIRARTKVVLTGEGADEMFGGYRRYADWRRIAWRERIARMPAARWLPDRPPFRGVRRLVGRDGAVFASVYGDTVLIDTALPGLARATGGREDSSRRFPDMRRRLLAVDRAAYLDSLLARQDRMAMAASVEARVPFVHVPLARVVDRVPLAALIPGGVTKPLLKTIAESHMPAASVHRRKVGLTLPFDAWLADPAGLGRYLDDVAAPDARLGAFAAPGRLGAMVDDFRAGRRGPLGLALIRLVNLETWLRSLDGPLPA
jgi:asparagine synthase (glutamine-hydrolysing)